MDFGGSFSFHKEFLEAPNPWLSLARLGTIGLPLSTREAAVIKSEAKHAPFGKGERTIVDRNIRDTWEMDASEVRMASSEPFAISQVLAQVTIENPKWQPFVDDVVEKVCRALGLDWVAIEPRCELYKLLLYEEGSQ